MKVFSMLALFAMLCNSAYAQVSTGYNNKNFSPSTLADLSDINCDLCGCYLGPDPNYNFNSAGIRYRFRSFSGNSSSELSNNELDHSGHSHEDDESYSTYELWGRYYISPKFQLAGTMPFSYNKIGDESFSGAGDMQVQAKYQIFNTEVDGSTKFRNRLFLGGGVKLPTGKFNQEDDSGEVVPHFQTGTGSFDFLLTGTYFAKSGGLGFVLDAVYKINTENKNKYLFGNQMNVNGVFSYDIVADNVTIIPYAGIYYEYAPEDKSDSVKDPNSGGNALFGNFGVDVTAGMIAFKLNYQPPFSQSLNGNQPQNDYRLIAGIGYSF
jgi:hypothetical protein